MSTGTPRFSVVICNYNYGDYIGQAIESVLGQTSQDYELIVVDDGSTDTSRSVIGGYDDKRLIPVFKPNGGQASAFNAGFVASKGDWIALLDSDDWWAKDKLERVARYIDAAGDRFAVVQHLLIEWCAGETRPYRSLRPSGDVWEDMCQNQHLDHFVPTSGLLFPRSVAERVFPVPESLWYSADAFLMRASVAWGPLFTIPEILAYRRVHEKSFTSTILKDSRALMKILIPELNAYYQRSGLGLRLDLHETGMRSLLRRMLRRLR